MKRSFFKPRTTAQGTWGKTNLKTAVQPPKRLQARKIGLVGSQKRATGLVGGKKRRKKGELTKAKARLWELCKKITRKRYGNSDGSWTCYTSGKRITDPKDAHTGHFIHSSLCSMELRFDLKNLRIQSYDQNINKNGNTLQYEENLIRDHGQEYVDELKRRNRATAGQPYHLDWVLAKIEEYQKIFTSEI